METYELVEAADRVGISVRELRELVAAGVVAPDEGGRFTPGHLRRAGLAVSLTEAGIPLEAFRDVGPVELKGVSGPMRLHAASQLTRSGSTASG